MEQQRPSPRILIVDDEWDLRDLLKLTLRELGYPDVREAPHALAGLKAINLEKPDLVLLDIMMPGAFNGMDLLRSLRQGGHKVPIIVITAMDPRYLILASHEGTLRKPFGADELQEAIEAALAPPPG